MKFLITIRFTVPQDLKNQIKDLEIPISLNFDKDDANTLTNIKWIKSMIRTKVSECSNRRLRLIYGGRVLNETTDFKKEVFEPRLKQLNDEESSDGAIKIFIHCLIGDILTSQQLADENKLDSSVQTRSTAPEVVGFDRLLQQGFSNEDIRDLRRQFHAIYNPSTGAQENGGAVGGEINDLEEEESRQRQIRQLEERWIESTITPDVTGTTGSSGSAGDRLRPYLTASDQLSNISGNNTTGGNPATANTPQVELEEVNGNKDLLLGLSIGVFLGVLSLVFLAVDDTVFNKSQKMAIIAGMFINFSFAIVRGQWV